jgi:hypothetical protein
MFPYPFNILALDKGLLSIKWNPFPRFLFVIVLINLDLWFYEVLHPPKANDIDELALCNY